MSLIRAECPSLHLRVIAVDASKVCQEIIPPFDLKDDHAEAFSEAITAGLLLSPLLENDERYTLRWAYTGQLEQLTVDVASKARVRGNIDIDEQKDDLFGQGGKIGVVKSNARRKLGEGMTLADRCHAGHDLATYFFISDQIPTAISTYCTGTQNLGVMFQGLPGAQRDHLDTLQNHFLENPISGTMSFSEQSLSKLLSDILKVPSTEVLIHRELECSTFCTCSREKIIAVLASFPIEELDSMISEDGGAQVDCEFCKKSVRFEAMDLREIIEAKST